MIYFMLCKGPGSYIKIGKAIDPWKRLREVNCVSPYEIVLLRVEKTRRAYAREKKLHAMFKEEHHKGEWFKPSEALMTYIMSLDPDVEKYRHELKVKARKKPKKKKGMSVFQPIDETESKVKAREAYERMGDLIEEM